MCFAIRTGAPHEIRQHIRCAGGALPAAEALLADATRFAAATGAADVRMTLEIWPHMIHVWHLWNAHLEPGRRALGNAGTFIRECL